MRDYRNYHSSLDFHIGKTVARFNPIGAVTAGSHGKLNDRHLSRYEMRRMKLEWNKILIHSFPVIRIEKYQMDMHNRSCTIPINVLALWLFYAFINTDYFSIQFSTHNNTIFHFVYPYRSSPSESGFSISE